MSHVEFGMGFEDIGGTDDSNDDDAADDDNEGGANAGVSQSGSAVDTLVVGDVSFGFSTINQDGEELLSSSLMAVNCVFLCRAPS